MIMNRKFYSLLLGAVLLSRGASATVGFAPWDSNGQFDPYNVFSYTVPPNIIPNFDATNFVINASFAINYVGTGSSPSVQVYQPRNTLNYTNTGLMTVNSGLEFDTLTTNQLVPHKMAANFYNSGGVYAGSTNGSQYGQIYYQGYGQILVNATNVYNPSGTLEVGYNGQIALSGWNLELEDGLLAVEPNPIYTNSYYTSSGVSIPNWNLTPSYGTNGGWIPGTALQATSASAPSPASFTLNNSTPYFDVKFDPNNSSNVIVRMVFIQSSPASLGYNVYFEPPNQVNPVAGNVFAGGVDIEWYAPYINPATGATGTNYLYLNDDMVAAAAPGAWYSRNGLPACFYFWNSTTPSITGTPATAGYQSGLPVTVFTNQYSAFSGSLIDISVATNAGPSFTGNITNLPGRIVINASNELSLADAVISGPNYISITCTNQFNGSGGASISAPYSDLNLGVTNGFLTISNLLQPTISQCSGPVQAYSGRFFTYPNVYGGSNDFRVLIIGDNFQTQSPSWIRNLILNATNLVVSDVLNVYGTLSANAQSLTLNSNQVGGGATSLDGELNWDSGSPFNTIQMPNLVWFTNNGAMRCLSTMTFGNSYTNYPYLVSGYQWQGGHYAPYTATNHLPSGWMGAVINNGVITNIATIASALVFSNNGVITSSVSSFTLQASSASFLNGATVAGVDVFVNATNLLINGETIVAGHALNLTGTASTGDGQYNLVANGLTNGNIWVVGASAVGGADSGLNITNNPFNGDFLGTTVTNYAPAGKTINNVWAGADRSQYVSGFQNNLALGHLILDAVTNSQGQAGKFTFAGVNGATNALYVDCLELRDYCGNLDTNSNPTQLSFPTNFFIYYAQAYRNGIPAAEKLNHTGLDNKGGVNHLRWVPSYVGYFSYTNLVYPDGTTNAVNMALAQSPDYSSGAVFKNGYPEGNNALPTQIFVPEEINLAVTLTNGSQRRLAWDIPASCTNYYVQYVTNLLTPNWVNLTNCGQHPHQPDSDDGDQCVFCRHEQCGRPVLPGGGATVVDIPV